MARCNKIKNRPPKRNFFQGKKFFFENFDFKKNIEAENEKYTIIFAIQFPKKGI